MNSKIPSTADNNAKTTLGETKDAAAKLNPTSGFLGWAKAMVMGILHSGGYRGFIYISICAHYTRRQRHTTRDHERVRRVQGASKQHDKVTGRSNWTALSSKGCGCGEAEHTNVQYSSVDLRN